MRRKEALDSLKRAFASASIPTAALDARLLCMHALGIDATALLIHDDIFLNAEDMQRLNAFAERRLAGESVARISGMREFWGLPFRLTPQTLEPRPDTETLVEAVLESCWNRQPAMQILDLGTGTGCILISILSEFPKATGVGVDISPEAVTVATENALLNNVGNRASFVVSDWLENVTGRFDLVVSNPPYIRSSVIAELEPEVRDFDPMTALDGGDDGLVAYRHIVRHGRTVLRDGGLLILEIGYDQKEEITGLGHENGFDVVGFREDLAGHTRVVILGLNTQNNSQGS